MRQTHKYTLEKKIDNLSYSADFHYESAEARERAGFPEDAARHRRNAERKEARLLGILEALDIVGYRVDFEEDENGSEHARIRPDGEDKDYSREAHLLCYAVRELARNEEALENFEDYLSRHFAWFCAFWASTPEDMTEEFCNFSTLEN